MNEPVKNCFDVLVDVFRQILREELNVLKTELNAGGAVDKDWLKADEAARLYGLPKTWFEERGRSGEIERTKPGRYVLFNRRDIERYLEEHKRKKSLTSPDDGTT